MPMLLSWLAASAPAAVPAAVAATPAAAENPAELPRGRGLAVDMSVAPAADQARPPISAPTNTPVTAPSQRETPRAGLRLSSRYGLRRDPLHGRHRMHHGVDIPGRRGTQVQASAAGRVHFAGVAGGYGRMVEIEHGDGVTTRYAHLDQILVPQGGMVSQGDTIGLMGATGRATGDHLHFEIRRNGQSIDPLPFLSGAQSYALAAPAAPQLRADRPLTTPEPSHISAFASSRDQSQPGKEDSVENDGGTPDAQSRSPGHS